MTIEKAKKSGFAIVGLRNTFSSNGSQAYYVERMAQHDLIGIMCSRNPASMSSFGGVEPVFGTNPLGCAFPTNENPLVFDMATSAMTFYSLVLAKARGEQIPENMAWDKNGNPTVDPTVAMGGSLLSFDRGHKGSSLAMMVEVLAGTLTNSGWVDNKTYTEEWGSLFIAIDPNLLIDIKDFKDNVSDLITKVKASQKKEGVSEIRLPGERALKNRQETEESGVVEIEDAVAAELGWA